MTISIAKHFILAVIPQHCQIKLTDIYTWNGRNTLYANLDELPRHVEFQKGDTIVTSGYSAVFPSGIIVGTVADFEKQHDDNFYSLQVELATDFQALNNVRIIKNFRQTEQIGVEQEAKRND